MDRMFKQFAAAVMTIVMLPFVFLVILPRLVSKIRESVGAAIGTEVTVEPSPPPTTPAAPVDPPVPAEVVEPTNWAPLWVVIGVIVALALTVVAVRLILRARRNSRAAAAAIAAATAALEGNWDAAKAKLAEVHSKFIDFEMDLLTPFTRSLLRNVHEPASAEFYARYDEASARDYEHTPATMDLVNDLMAAAIAADRAFDAANDNALRKAAIGIGPDGTMMTKDQRARMNKARKLMENALDDGATRAEAQAHYEKAVELLDGVYVIPEKAQQRFLSQLEAKGAKLALVVADTPLVGAR